MQQPKLAAWNIFSQHEVQAVMLGKSLIFLSFFQFRAVGFTLLFLKTVSNDRTYKYP